jgi:hypothetical protein
VGIRHPHALQTAQSPFKQLIFTHLFGCILSIFSTSTTAGGKCAYLRNKEGRPTGQHCLYSIVGALDPTYELPDDRLLCVPTSDKEKDLAFPSPAAAGWGNAVFLALCMKLAYEVCPKL